MHESMESLCRRTISELIIWRFELQIDGNRIKASKINRIIVKLHLLRQEHKKQRR